jgi:PAP2 superfamily
MRISKYAAAVASLFCVSLAHAQTAHEQTAANLAALRGLAPVSALQASSGGKVALKANLAVTGAIQQGWAHQPTLRPFAEEQQEALRDAFITGSNALELSDGLGTSLEAAYKADATCTSSDDGQTSNCTNLSPAIADFIAYASSLERSDAEAAKFFFGNATLDGKAPVSADTMATLTKIDGTPDIFGKAYGLVAGSKGANPYGNSRPFMTEPRSLTYEGKDYFGVPLQNVAYLRGPVQDLTASPSFPSGHTAYGYTEALLLGILVPERYSQMVVRGADYGNHRIIIGAHYTMDVLGGRTLAEYDLAQLLANKPGYVGEKRRGLALDDFRQALELARADINKALTAGCGASVAICARNDHGRFADAGKDRTFYEATQTYGLPVVYTKMVSRTEDVGKVAPEAGYLLTAAFPYLSLAQADAILTETEGPGGRFLDNGSAFGVYSRLDLYRASLRAMATKAAR